MRILLFQGGSSVEHDVSLSSAAYIKQLLEELGHTVLPVFVTKEGRFFFQGKELKAILGSGFENLEADIAFPLIHGYGGEDGLLQSLLELLKLPFASENTLTSSIGMHKEIQLKLFKEAGIPILDSICIEKGEKIPLLPWDEVVVKPEAGGSSIGVFFVRNEEEAICKALEEVFRLDKKAILQPYLKQIREVETGVYYDKKNKELHILGPVEIRYEGEFFDYKVKYSSATTVLKEEEVVLTKELKQEIRKLSEKAFHAVSGEMYMRIDFFLTKDNKIYLNEINTIPGMTENSHFPVLAGGKEGMKKILTTLLSNALLIREEQKNISHE